ncbi:serpin-ZX-like [Silene latifolia]|uniref:serpin-ZX-like n=1 Tax=Silene latifolia TaxID=37657 RepID=UPI003D775A54
MDNVDKNLRRLIKNQTHVSFNIAHHVLLSESTPTNSVSSPLSLQVILGLLAAASSGSTRDELLSVLGSNSIDDLNKLFSEIVPHIFADASSSGGPKLNLANGIWVDQSLPLFKPEFKRVVEDLYKASCAQVDFLNNADEVASEVNSWAEKQTSGLIKDLLPPGSVDETTEVIFANALYFKGAWNHEFDASETKEDDFHLLDGTSVKVPYMTSYRDQFIKTCNGFKVLCLPYKKGEDKREFSMYVLLPDKKDGLLALSKKVASKPGFLNKRRLPYEKVEVISIRLPRFKISFGFEASKVLKDLGFKLALSGAGLTEMVDSAQAENLGVSSIFHKSFIEVNEEGTEAAAASAASKYMCASDDPEVEFVADHPFMYLIRENKTGVVLFVGHVVNPLEG